GASLYPRYLSRRAELAPAQAVVAVEDERRVCRSRTQASQLAITVQLRCGADALGMESHAPAAAKDAVVVLHQRGERRPRRFVERSDTVGGRSHEINVAPLTKISDPEPWRHQSQRSAADEDVGRCDCRRLASPGGQGCR